MRPVCRHCGVVLVALVMLPGCAGWLRPTAESAVEDAAHLQAMLYFVQAKEYESKGNHLGAIVALRSAADLDPSSPTIFAQLARNYDRIQDFRMAVVFGGRALDLDPELTALRFQMVRWLDAVGEPEDVAVHMRALIERDPHNWQLYSHLARVYLESGQEDLIDDLFDRLLEQPDTPADVRVNVAYVLSRTGRRELSEQIFSDVLADDPTVEDAWLGLGELQVAKGERLAALASLREGARRVPDSSLIMYELARVVETPEDLAPILPREDAAYLYRLGIALSEMEKFPLAARVFEQIVGQTPVDVDGWLDPVRYYLHVGRLDRAEEILDDALAAMPDSLQLYLFWGTALEKEDRHEDALAVYRRASEQLPDSLSVYLMWGWNLEQRKLWDAAVDVYRQGIVNVGPEPQLYIRWGIVYGQQQRWHDAIGRYRKVVETDSMYADGHLHWGVALQKVGEWDAAVARLARAAELMPDDGFALFYLGSALEQASRERPGHGYFDRAVTAFRRLIELSPDDAYALNYLGYSFAERGIHLEEAVDLLTRAIRLEPDNGAFFDSLGWAYYRMGELGEAERYLGKAMEQMAGHEQTEQAVILNHAGDIANALGKREVAVDRWRQALDLTPGNEELQKKLGPDSLP
ncbi:MAG TPA: tetratricopeptide repeat protein [Candidatus Latescibacteria bacterium]|jgi:tetratricopeptide (TPR) repeat protein|nr:tetratricopeptide repeat protein [Candidatus Latescibacterota bacterium]HJP33857.1 tetratricopeptide repeat protein [Candidatus Latescibacterota bacterium]